ncbi:hypothetical protein FHS14_003351 [Paenibacillus baekrokdamisoli]|nr:hypothetical protein [Paenibacillus baekrokdamisoli]
MIGVPFLLKEYRNFLIKQLINKDNTCGKL